MNFKTKAAILYSFALIFFLVNSPTTLANNLDNVGELEAFLDGVFAIQQREYNIPGISVAVIKDGELILAKGYGWADLDKQIPMEPTTLHRPGSNSKILVWTAVMQLVEQGILDLYRDINDYLDFTIPLQTVQGREVPPLTLHHLLTHTGGFEEVLTGIFVTNSQAIQPLEDYVRNYLPKKVFAPGELIAYSNYGTALAAYIVELVSGRDFASYSQEHIFEPLKMTTSTFEQPVTGDLANKMSKGYYTGDGQLLAGEFEYIQPYPVGGLTSSTLDMVNLILAHLQLGSFQETKILTENTAKEMQKQQFTAYTGLPGMTYGFIEENYNGYHVLSHGGDTGFFHTGLYLLPVEQVGLYVVYNSKESAPARWNFFTSFMDQYFPAQTITSLPQTINLADKDNYTGTFHSARSNYTGPESWLRFVQNTTLHVDQEGYLVLTINDKVSRYGEIKQGLFQEVNGKGLMGITFQNGLASKLHFGGPETFVRTPWYQTRVFMAGLLLVSILVMLLILLGWIKQLFSSGKNSQTLGLAKSIGTLFILASLTTPILFVDSILDFHPELGLPLMFFEFEQPLKIVTILAKFVGGLGILLFVTSIYLWIKKKGSTWQRFYFSILTLSAGGVLWIFWQVNLL